MTAAFGALAVTGIGMVSSLGHDVVSSCAAARAGLSLSSELKSLNFSAEGLFGDETIDGPPVVFGHVVRGIADGFVGVAQTLLLGVAALEALRRQRTLSDRELTRTGLHVNVSDYFVQDVGADPESDEETPPSAQWKERCARLLPRLCAGAGFHMIAEPQRQLHHGGHAGFARVVENAATRIAAGQIDRCLVGGIDSRAGADFLLAAARFDLLQTNNNPVGLIPGEAAVFALLERPADAARLGLPVQAVVTGVHRDNDPVGLLSEEPPTGAALTRVMRAALAGTSRGFLVGDLNGTQRRATERGLTLVRLREDGPAVAGFPSWFPATSFGDCGAAAGAVGLAVVTRAFARGYAPASDALVCLSSESGETGAITMRAHES